MLRRKEYLKNKKYGKYNVLIINEIDLFFLYFLFLNILLLGV